MARGDGQAKLEEAVKMLEGLEDPHGRRPTVADAIAVSRLLADAMSGLPDWVWDNPCCPPGESCCMCD